MYMEFDDLPKNEKRYLIEVFGLPDRESAILTHKYVDGMSYARIAGEMCISEKSVGPLLHRARRHMVDIAKECGGLLDERAAAIVEILGWSRIEWPVLTNRRKDK